MITAVSDRTAFRHPERGREPPLSSTRAPATGLGASAHHGPTPHPTHYQLHCMQWTALTLAQWAPPPPHKTNQANVRMSAAPCPLLVAPPAHTRTQTRHGQSINRKRPEQFGGASTRRGTTPRPRHSSTRSASGHRRTSRPSRWGSRQRRRSLPPSPQQRLPLPGSPTSAIRYVGGAHALPPALPASPRRATRSHPQHPLHALQAGVRPPLPENNGCPH